MFKAGLGIEYRVPRPDEGEEAEFIVTGGCGEATQRRIEKAPHPEVS